MFLKNSMRPAFATASAAGQASDKKKKNDSFMYSETDDFGSFSESGESSGAGRSAGKKSGNFKLIGIIAAAVVVVVLLIVLIASIAGSSGGHVEYENNSFVAFCDEDGIYRVAANGKVVGEYENEIELIVASDRSFAYIIESSDDGQMMYIVDGKRDVTEVTTSPVSKVLATAEMQPGIVWLDTDNGVYHYTAKRGEERITRDIEETRAMDEDTYFHISADAETVVYTKYDAEKNQEYLCVYNESTETKFQRNMYPVAVSDDGSMIYAYGLKDNVKKSLYVLPFNDENDRYLISDNFNSIIDINTKGNEIVFTTIGDTDTDVTTYIVAFDIKKMDEVAQPARIAKGYSFTPKSVDPKVARFATFADCYFEADVSLLELSLDSIAPVYYVNKNFEIRRISKFSGKFSPDGKFFYYTNNDNTLQRVDLGDEDAVSEKIAEDIIAFEVTSKGNVYCLRDTSTLIYYNTAKEKNTRIADNVESISMYSYTNVLYYTVADMSSVYTTEEGSTKKETAKFDSSIVTGLPVFADKSSKKTFVTFYDSDNEEWRMFYTSNGKKFNLIAVCYDVQGFDVDYLDLLQSVIGDMMDSITPNNNNTTDTDKNNNTNQNNEN